MNGTEEFQNWKKKKIEYIKNQIRRTDSINVIDDILDMLFDNAYIQGGNEAYKKAIEIQSEKS